MIWEKIDESTYKYDEGGVRFFLLMGKKEALLIDSGMQTHNAKELLLCQSSLKGHCRLKEERSFLLKWIGSGRLSMCMM